MSANNRYRSPAIEAACVVSTMALRIVRRRYASARWTFRAIGSVPRARPVARAWRHAVGSHRPTRRVKLVRSERTVAGCGLVRAEWCAYREQVCRVQHQVGRPFVAGDVDVALA